MLEAPLNPFAVPFDFHPHHRHMGGIGFNRLRYPSDSHSYRQPSDYRQPPGSQTYRQPLNSQDWSPYGSSTNHLSPISQAPTSNDFNHPLMHRFGWRTAAATGAPQDTGALYNELEVPKDATLAVIEKAYRRLARTYHPDKQVDKSDDSKFKTVLALHDSQPQLTVPVRSQSTVLTHRQSRAVTTFT